MVKQQMVSLDQARQAYAEDIVLHPENLKRYGRTAPYFVSYVWGELINKFGEDAVNKGGLRVYTTLDTRIQHYMDESVQTLISGFQDRVRGKSALIKRLNAKSDSTLSDSIFNELTIVQIAFVCLEPHSGQILAMIGGRDFEKYKYNRAVQAPRQPGSAFKPFVYTAAIDNGYTPADEFLNQPFVLINDDGTRWTPHNYDNDVSGLMTLREALAGSKNLVTIRLIQEIGPALVRRGEQLHRIHSPRSPAVVVVGRFVPRRLPAGRQDLVAEDFGEVIGVLRRRQEDRVGNPGDIEKNIILPSLHYFTADPGNHIK
jgi:penicillin-binding protein 1A